MGQLRRRVVQTHSLEERLTQRAKELFKQAAALPPGIKKEALKKLARQAEVAAHMSEWLSSPEASTFHPRDLVASVGTKKRRNAVG
jgi:hypothetical protein